MHSAMRMINATTLLTVLVAYQSVAGQGAQFAERFEVASIRPVIDSAIAPLSQLVATLPRVTPAGQFVGRIDLKDLVRFGYSAQPYERAVAARQADARSLDELFEIRAVPPQTASAPTREEVNAMIRQMLVERFGLEVRIDTELVSATVLQTIKPGVLGRGLRPAPEGCRPLPAGANPYDGRFADAYIRNCVVTLFGDRLRGTVTLKDFALTLSLLARRPILDRTELEGTFTIDVAVASASVIPQPSARLGATAQQGDAPAFVDAIRDQMGLSARRERLPIRLFVVDRVGPLVEN